MNRYAILVAMILLVVCLIVFLGNEESHKTGYHQKSGETKSGGEHLNSEDMIPRCPGTNKKGSIRQGVDLSEAVMPPQNANSMENYETKVIEKAEKLIDRNKTIPSGVAPLVETDGDFTIVYWPIPREGEDFVPGPSRFAAVYFHKGTLVVEGVLGPH